MPQITVFNEADMTVEFTVASETPFARLDENGVAYAEVLVIGEDNIDLRRLKDGASVLFNHDADEILGATTDAWITDDGKLAVKAQFRSADEKAANLFKDIQSGTVRNVSIGYIVDEIEFGTDTDGNRIGRVTRWTPYEVSVVGIPADETVGFYRSMNISNTTTNSQNKTKEEKKRMTDAEKKELERLQALAAEEAAAEAETAETAEPAPAEPETKNDDTAAVCAAERSIAKAAKVRSMSRIESVRESVPQFNIANALRSMLDPSVNVAKERKLSDELYSRAGLSSNGNSFMFRDFSSLGSGANAAGLVGTTYHGDLFVEALRSKMAVKEATWITDLKGIHQFGAQTGEVEASWYDNVNADLTSSDPKTELMSLSPKKLGAVVKVKRDTIISVNVDSIALVINDLISAIDRKLDKSILTGDATAAIKGVAGTTGVNAVEFPATVATATWQDFLKFGGAVEDYELDGMPRFIMCAGDRQILKGISKDAGSGRYICEDNRIDGYEADICGRLKTGEIFFGDWSQVLIGSWGGLEIFINPYKYGNGIVEIEGTIIADVAIRQPKAFCVAALG
jgi:HK97 family phage major capsid protein/HK97 family phage prohead protease